jgi:hypothetical protein
MASDITVVMDDRPGMLAAMAEALGKAGVNIDGLAAITTGGKGYVHVLVEDAAAASAALKSAGIDVGEMRDVLVLEVDNTPGILGAISRKIADAGVNIEQAYIASGNRIVIAADDLEKAAAAI